jgi:hypothetical protein
MAMTRTLTNPPQIPVPGASIHPPLPERKHLCFCLGRTLTIPSVPGASIHPPLPKRKAAMAMRRTRTIPLQIPVPGASIHPPLPKRKVATAMRRTRTIPLQIPLQIPLPGASIRPPLQKRRAATDMRATRTVPLPTSRQGLFTHPPLPKEFKAMSAALQRRPVSLTFVCAVCVGSLSVWRLITGYEWGLRAPPPHDVAGSSTKAHGKSYISGITSALLICSFEMGRARTAATTAF